MIAGDVKILPPKLSKRGEPDDADCCMYYMHLQNYEITTDRKTN